MYMPSMHRMPVVRSVALIMFWDSETRTTTVVMVPGPLVNGIDNGINAISRDLVSAASWLDFGLSISIAMVKSRIPPAILNAPMEKPKIWNNINPVIEKNTRMPVEYLTERLAVFTRSSWVRSWVSEMNTAEVESGLEMMRMDTTAAAMNSAARTMSTIAEL